MPNITVNSNGAQSFTPVIFPTTGTVEQGDPVTFQSAGTAAVTFYAASGLFYWPVGQTQTTNTGSDALTAPASSSPTPLSLVVAADPTVTTSFTLSLNANPGDDNDPGPGDTSDGTINVSTKPTEESVTDRPHRARQRRAPAPAMRARGSD